MILPRYTKKDGLIMITMLTPVTIVMNLFLFGHRYFSEWPVFFGHTIVTFIIHAISWQFHTRSLLFFATVFLKIHKCLPEFR